MEKFQNEEELLVRYELHMRLLERLKEVKEEGGNYTDFLDQAQLQDNEKAVSYTARNTVRQSLSQQQ